jgi:hypothetical protein
MHYLAIESVCLNDPKWLEFLAGAEQSPEEGLIQTFLSKGLISAHTVVQAGSIERRKEILGTPAKITIQPTLESVIEEILEKAGNYPMLHEFEDEDSLQFIRQPLWHENEHTKKKAQTAFSFLLNQFRFEDLHTSCGT